MSEPPMFSRLDADRILRRAAEIEGSEDPKPISAAELRSIAGEAGFGSHAVERAIAEAHREETPSSRPLQVQRSGWVIAHLSSVRVIPIGISSDELMSTVRLFQPYREGPAQVQLEEHQISWVDRKGLHFTMTSSGGLTEVRVHVSKVVLRKGRWMGWVRSAADRLEALVLLVATEGLSVARDGLLPTHANGAGPTS